MSLLRAPMSVRLCHAGLRVQKTATATSSRCLSQASSQWAKSSPASDSSPNHGSQSTEDPAGLVAQEASSNTMPAHHQPSYGARVDHGTSTYSPVPKRVMDGSEAGDVVAAAVVSGAPVDLQARQVRIFRPAKTATQSGTWHGHHWRMDWDILQKGHRWENPLMGWQSSADAMQGTHLNFRTKEEAIQFAQKQGYEYFVQEPNERRIVPKAYANNFVHEPKTLKHIKTK